MLDKIKLEFLSLIKPNDLFEFFWWEPQNKYSRSIFQKLVLFHKALGPWFCQAQWSWCFLVSKTTSTGTGDYAEVWVLTSFPRLARGEKTTPKNTAHPRLISETCKLLHTLSYSSVLLSSMLQLHLTSISYTLYVSVHYLLPENRLAGLPPFRSVVSGCCHVVA